MVAVHFLSANWGDIASVLGLIIALGGFGWAIRESRKARSASEAAQQATKATRKQVAVRLRTVDFERAFAVVNRLKLLHSIERWEAAIEQYQTLRMMIGDILSYHLQADVKRTERLRTVRVLVARMERYVEGRINDGFDARDHTRLSRRLAEIQEALEQTADSEFFDD